MLCAGSAECYLAPFCLHVLSLQGSDVFKAIVADNYCSASPGRESGWLGHSAGRLAGRPDARLRPGVRPATRPDARPDARPEVRPDARPDVQPDVRPNARLGLGLARPNTSFAHTWFEDTRVWLVWSIPLAEDIWMVSMQL